MALAADCRAAIPELGKNADVHMKAQTRKPMAHASLACAPGAGDGGRRVRRKRRLDLCAELRLKRGDSRRGEAFACGKESLRHYAKPDHHHHRFAPDRDGGKIIYRGCLGVKRERSNRSQNKIVLKTKTPKRNCPNETAQTKTAPEAKAPGAAFHFPVRKPSISNDR
jgi:hypothetical protein